MAIKTTVLLGLVLLCSGCVTTGKLPKPVISDISRDQVKVQARALFGKVDEVATWNEAVRGCRLHDRRAVPISGRCFLPGTYGGCNGWEYLYACVLDD